ncbi:MAG: PAS domain-containing protein [Nitrospirae bacterium]|nr:PAS domain-containing protein [Nitrospirota bacterium]
MAKKKTKIISEPVKTRGKKQTKTKATWDVPIAIVGIGASAGGLDALERFFRNMPSDSGLAFVVVQHLSPNYKSLMVELLSKHTAMNVYRAEDGMPVEANTTYLIPPKKNLTIFHGKLYLTDLNNPSGQGHFLNLPIDIFFRSLAEDQGDRAIGIILSGTGSDGTLGIRAIKGAGGMVMAQDADSAKFDGMPMSAAATGLLDYVLPPDKMSDELLKYVKHPFIHKGDKVEELILKDEDNLSKILGILRERTGVDFTFYKPNTIVRRIERRISINQINRIEDYVVHLAQSPSEARILYKDLLIGVTKFFRDEDAFQIIAQKVIPNIFEGRNSNSPIRVWSVGCSTGEEAYSLAIMLKEYMDASNKRFDVKVFATDLDKDAVEYAGTGIYPESIISDISHERLQLHFTKKDGGYQINENIRRMVIFAVQNILTDPPFSKIDLTCCRNMLIYFQPVMQKKVLHSLHYALNRNGYLFLGSSESLGDLNNSFAVVDSKWKVYRDKIGSKLPLMNDFVMPTVKKGSGAINKIDAGYPVRMLKIDDPLDIAYQSLVARFAPPSVIIDENHELLHVFGDLARYIKIPTGKASLNIVKMVRKELAMPLNTAIHKALKKKGDVIYKDLKIKDEDGTYLVNITVHPVIDEKSKRLFIILTFEENISRSISREEADGIGVDEIRDQRIADLEQALQYTKENLQASIEEMETSNEELQSTNEELIASNEELQSTNEELQSVNEELYTVNSEYQKKIEELTDLNNDIINLYKNTNIGTLFLDLQMNIRKFTPAISDIVNIMDRDLGRPIQHFSHNIHYPNFITDIESVTKTLISKETEVESWNNKYFLMKIDPYRTVDNAIAGIVITFIDITERKGFEERLKVKHNLLSNVCSKGLICEKSPTGKIILDAFGTLVFANNSAENIIAKDEEILAQFGLSAPGWRITDNRGNLLNDNTIPYKHMSLNRKPFFDYRYSEISGKSKLKLLVSGYPVFGSENEFQGCVFTIDSTEKMMITASDMTQPKKRKIRRTVR